MRKTEEIKRDWASCENRGGGSEWVRQSQTEANRKLLLEVMLDNRTYLILILDKLRELVDATKAWVEPIGKESNEE